MVPVWQSRLDTMTVHAPQPPSLHPNLVPVKRSVSRRKESNVWLGRAAAASFSATRAPLTKRMGVVRYPEEQQLCAMRKRRVNDL
jgi:hypothetical protein